MAVQIPVMSCKANYQDYRFSFSNNRFLTIYPIGYTGGDIAKDTPFVSGGTCTKID